MTNMSDNTQRGRPATRRRQVLGYVQGQIQEAGRAPSYAMICRELRIGTRTEVRRIVAALEQQGLLRRTGKGAVRRIALS